jgi:IS5 family transposase
MELVQQPTLANSICDLRSRKIKRTFFIQMNTLIDWKHFVFIINLHYTKGKSATGKPSFSGLLLFKISLLQT